LASISPWFFRTIMALMHGGSERRVVTSRFRV
jgi:hypothetical protein